MNFSADNEIQIFKSHVLMRQTDRQTKRQTDGQTDRETLA